MHCRFRFNARQIHRFAAWRGRETKTFVAIQLVVSPLPFKKQESDKTQQNQRCDLAHLQNQKRWGETDSDEPGDASIAEDAAVKSPQKVRACQKNGQAQ